MGAHDGTLARYLALDGHAVYATEISMKSFQTLKTGVQSSAVTIRQGDGLAPLVGDPLDCVVIAGMGYDTIVQIIEAKSELISTSVFIVQPMQGGMMLHRAILNNHWAILKADLAIYRDRFYPTWLINIAKTPSFEHRTARELFIPTEFRGSRGYRAWIDEERIQLCYRMRYNNSSEYRQQLAWIIEELERTNADYTRGL